MRVWTDRPKDEAFLLNPTFCCIILSASIRSYMDERRDGFPFPLAFMVLPIVLHKPTRDALPSSVRTSLAAWIQENFSLRVMFYERLISLKPHTRESLMFGMLYDWISLNNDGHLETNQSEIDIKRAIRKLSDETHDCALRARFLGKWFALAGNPNTIMAFWGIQP